MTLELGGTYIEPGAKATDNTDGDLTNKIMISGAVNVNMVGVYQLSYSVNDAAGNKSNTAARKVEVLNKVITVDSIPPVLTLLGDSQMTVELGNSYSEPGANAMDDVDGDISNLVNIAGSVDVNTVGVYELAYSVKDLAGNMSNVETRTINVIELVTLPPDTQIIRDVEVFKGTLSKRDPIVTHNIQITDAGQLDIEMSYVGKTAPDLTISGLDFSGTSSSFNVDPGNYTMTLKATSDGSTKFTVNITYPAREVPLGAPEVRIYTAARYIMLTIALMILLTIVLLRRRKINQAS